MRCEAQKDPTLRGGATLGWQVEATGLVTNATLVETTRNNVSVEGCLVRQVKSWVFPTSDRATIIAKYPVRFGVSLIPRDGGKARGNVREGRDK